MEPEKCTSLLKLNKTIEDAHNDLPENHQDPISKSKSTTHSPKLLVNLDSDGLNFTTT